MKESDKYLIELLVQRALDSTNIYEYEDPVIHISRHPDASPAIMEAVIYKLEQHGFTVEIQDHFDPDADDSRKLGQDWGRIPHWLIGDPGGNLDLNSYVIHTRYPRFITIIQDPGTEAHTLWIDPPKVQAINSASLINQAVEFHQHWLESEDKED